MADPRTSRTPRDAPSRACAGPALAVSARVPTVEALDRCSAYVATREALAATRRAMPGWPAQLAEPACEAASRAVVATAHSMAYAVASAGRRRCARDAIEAALQLAATCDVAIAMGLRDELGDVPREASRAVAMLGLFLHANTGSWPEDDDG
jgi:hypothetical protein